MIKISIITINYNNCCGLQKTLESIRCQTDKRFEYIVVDGCSSDGSLDLIKENLSIINKWISEKDKGIYDAMNKGVTMASGEYIIFVNSGDCLHNNNVISQINNLTLTTDICMGRVQNLNNKGEGHLWMPPSEDKISLNFLRWNPLHHPGAIIRTAIQRKYPYNPDLKICSDRQFFIESLIIGNATYSTVNITINSMEPQNASGSESTKKMELEDKIILSQLFTPRQLRDIESSNYMLENITRPLTHYYGKARIMIKINKILFNILGIR